MKPGEIPAKEAGEKAMKDVMDFLSAARPWIGMGLLLAVFFAYSERKKAKKEKE